MLSARTAEGSVPKIFGSCDAIATLESTRTSNALRTKGRSSTCVYNICESICANAGLKAYAIHGVTGRRIMKRKKIERLEGGSPPAWLIFTTGRSSKQDHISQVMGELTDQEVPS